MPINMPVQQRSPIEGILGVVSALNAMGVLPGETHEKIKALQASNALNSERNDPSSQVSKAAQLEAAQAQQYMAKHGYTDKESSGQLLGLINGSPASSNEEDYYPATPGLSAAALDKNPEANPMLALIKGQQAADAMGNKFNSVNDTKKEIQENNIHQQVLGKLQKDPTLAKQLVQYQNLNNSLSLLTNADHITPQQFDEFQQSIRGNLGIKGSSGVDERSHVYLNSLGLNADRIGQFLTGKPASMDPNDPFFTHLKQLASVEQQNINKQTQNRMNALTSGNGWLYDKRPDLKVGLDSAVDAAKGQFANVSASEPSQGSGGLIPSASAAGQDMVSVVSPEGKVGKIPKSNLDAAVQRGFKINGQ